MEKVSDLNDCHLVASDSHEFFKNANFYHHANLLPEWPTCFMQRVGDIHYVYSERH